MRTPGEIAFYAMEVFIPAGDGRVSTATVLSVATKAATEAMKELAKKVMEHFVIDDGACDRIEEAESEGEIEAIAQESRERRKALKALLAELTKEGQ